MIKSSILIVLYCFLSIGLRGQDFEFLGKSWGREEGLSSNLVFDLYEDRAGYLWVASNRGLDRFDGEKFDHFSYEDGLTDLIIFQLKEDSRGRIWGLTANFNLFHFDPEKLDFTPYKYNDSLMSFTNEFRVTFGNLAFDREENLYLGFESRPGGLRISSEGQLTKYDLHPQQDKMELVNFQDGQAFSYFLLGEKGTDAGTLLIRNGLDSLRIPFEDHFSSGGKVLLLEDGTAYNILGKSVIVSRGAELLHKWDFDKRIVQISHTRTGDIWISLIGGGIVRVDKNQRHSQFFNKTTVSKAVVDYEGGVWLGLIGTGIFHTRSESKGTFKPKKISRAQAILPIDSRQFILLDGKKRLRYFGPGFKELPMRHPGPWYVLEKESQGSFLVLKRNGIYRLKGERDPDIIPVFDEEHGGEKGKVRYFLIGDEAFEDTVYAANPHYFLKIPADGSPVIKEVKFPNVMYSITRIGPDDFLLGTKSGVFRYSDTLTYLGTENPLYKSKVAQLIHLQDAVLMGSFGEGIGILREGKLTHIKRGDGLSGNIVNGIEVIGDSIAYIGTNKGVDRLRLTNEGYVIENLLENLSHGLVEPECFLLRGDTLIIGHLNGLIWVNLSGLEPTPYQPRLELERIEINDEEVPLNDLYEVPYSNNKVTIYYKGISFLEKDPVFHYRVSNLNANWQTTQKKVLDFLSLPPGNHQIEIKRCHPELPELCTQITIPVKIKTPIWQMWWIYLLGSLVLILLGWGIMRRRSKKRLQKAALNKQLVELELKSLRSQMNPHFIFNTINSIQDFILHHDVWDAQDYLARFGRLIRKTLESSRNDLITLAAEIKILKDYIKLESIRLNYPFETEIDFPDDLNPESVLLPPLVIQPLVENAIWHGLAPMNRSGHLKISFRIHENWIECSVEDDGIGRVLRKEQQDNHHREDKSIGLEITQQRLALFNRDLPRDLAPFIAIEDLYGADQKPHGTKVTLIFTTELNAYENPYRR